MQRFAKHVRNISGLSIVQKLFVLGYICINSGNCQLLRIYSRVGEGCEDMRNKALRDRLNECGFKIGQRYLTPRQVELIYEFLGEP